MAEGGPEPPPFDRESTRTSAVAATTAVVISAILGPDRHHARCGPPPSPSGVSSPDGDGGPDPGGGGEGGPAGGRDGGPEGGRDEGPEGGWEGGPEDGGEGGPDRGPEGGPVGRPEDGGSTLTSTPDVGFPRRSVLRAPQVSAGAVRRLHTAFFHNAPLCAPVGRGSQAGRGRPTRQARPPRPA
ncbi:hypothetical protein Saso_18780 [Streptomyces asoensis]|uniref:Uncharacterized protein n=1 Tax=Streptomyces asoensis TaxID=249586 RepID=A0ABQ3RWM0_9ACTN|nr:hypothetical protein GCM10010496_34200 [Streptomyces asoensis]GHI60228.1 hypothetical protein Saso_18780 [Streptomyces asoensis]